MVWLFASVAMADPSLVGVQYVKLVDRAGYVDSHSSPGADIDAVALIRAGATVSWASEVVTADVGEGRFGNQAADPKAALGPEDHPPATLEGFVALGGPGHHLVLKLGAPAQAGDQLTVYEVGRVGGRPEHTEICVAHEPTGPWTSLGSGYGAFTVELTAERSDPDSACKTRKLS